MVRRTTIELDMELIARAKEALGLDTTRAVVEESLRRAAASAEGAKSALAARQREHFRKMREWADLDVLASDEMWR